MSAVGNVVQIVPFPEADRDEIYTMSAEGVTLRFANHTAELTELHQWQEERRCFLLLKQKKLFSHFWMWKGFRSTSEAALYYMQTCSWRIHSDNRQTHLGFDACSVLLLACSSTKSLQA